MAIRFTKKQRRDGNFGEDADFAEWYVEDFMKDHLPQYYYNVSDAGKREMVINGRRYAREFNLHDPEAQAYFITLMWEIGANFYTFPGFSDVLSREGVHEMEKINLLLDGTVTEDQAIKAIMAPDDRYWYRDNLKSD
ncbi:hypothetical protein [Paracoccus onubensis]|uniref:Uncharacterized protein n=1 Tax=Paracoccus onubensis TaxID=1675788 RepID=A0A418SNM5_9RHOB|nr:hypothetical protein [Paracoccus onubensis]RJE82571.1 hypothetical protein D3P04_19615 [Paracoccus onubensis]